MPAVLLFYLIRYLMVKAVSSSIYINEEFHDQEQQTLRALGIYFFLRLRK